MTGKPIRQVGFIGTGLMGTPMVRRLLAGGFSVRLGNRTPEKLQGLVAAGAARAALGVYRHADREGLLQQELSALISLYERDATDS